MLHPLPPRGTVHHEADMICPRTTHVFASILPNENENPRRHQTKLVEMPSRTTIRRDTLRPLPDVHGRAIYRVICPGSYALRTAAQHGKAHLGVGFALRCV